MGEMAHTRRGAIALVLNQEIAGVVTALRQNAKWAMVPTRYTRSQDDDMGDDPLLEEFKVLRRRIFHWHDWSVVDPMQFLSPFLEVIRSPETSGPITGTALTSLTRFLEQDILGACGGDLGDVMRRTADAVTQCKFESTDPSSDDTVLFKILQVLLACVRCPGGRCLTDSNVINIFQACFRIGHYTGDHQKDLAGRHADLLTAASRQVMLALVSILFGGLGGLPHSPQGGAHAGKLPSLLGEALAPAAAAAAPAAAADPPQPGGGGAAAAAAERNGNGGGSGPSEGGADPPAAAAADAAPEPAPATVAVPGLGDASAPGTPAAAAAAAAPPPGGEAPEAGHGLDSVVEVLGFVIGLINSDAQGQHADLPAFGLELMTAALNAGGAEFARHEDLMLLLREDVWQALTAAAARPQLGALAGAGQVALALWACLGGRLLLQLEAFLQLLLAFLGQGSRGASHHHEAALEVLLDLCNQPGFARAAYANLDCRVERSNLFEGICSLLSKSAFPVNVPLTSVHTHALEGLFAILATLSRGCTGMAAWDGLEDGWAAADFSAAWQAVCSGAAPPLLPGRRGSSDAGEGAMDSPRSRARARADGERRAAVAGATLERLLKGRLALAAEHFNRDHKKALLYLQSIQLLSEPPQAAEVARFLRHCPGLSKQTVGDLLGEHDDFYLEVLDEFTRTFDFQGLHFDAAMRAFLESFRLPGEAQKINRIMESFGACYHAQCPDIFRNADAVYILAYSVILLNTDQHNSQVKRKMSCDDFVRNNRGINGGENLPQPFLAQLYESIRRNEIRISSEAPGNAPDPGLWAAVARASVAPRGAVLDLADLPTPALDRQMFGLMWGPTVAAASVVLDHAEDAGAVRHTLDGLLQAARVAAFHRVDGVMDSLVVSLSKFTAALDPGAPRPALAFGENEKARLATQALFALANRYGDSLRSGWRNLLACVVRLFQLNLLPPSVLLLESEDTAAARERIPRPSASRRTPASASLLSRAFSSLISIDSGESAEQRPREAAASRHTAACIEACRLDELFADSKFLRAESLIELVKAVMWAAGPVHRIAASGEDSDVAEVGLELIVVIALRNRDRLLLIWPLVHDLLAAVLAPEAARAANPLVRRAALGLLRVCRRLLHYKADSAPALLRSLQVVLHMDPAVAWELAPAIAEEVLGLVRSAGDALQAPASWHTVCLLIRSTALAPAACLTALEALRELAALPALGPAAFGHCLETAATFVSVQDKAVQPEAGLRALQVLGSLFDWLLAHQQGASGGSGSSQRQQPAAEHLELRAGDGSPAPPPQREPEVPELWAALLKLLVKAAAEQQPRVQAEALQLLLRLVTGSESLQLPAAAWLEAVRGELMPLTAHLAHRLATNRREGRQLAPPLRAALKLLSRALLTNLPALAAEPGFPKAWADLLQLFQDCTRTKSEELLEAVPEALKNMLLVMAAKGLLTPAWQDGEGDSLWELTWARAQAVSSGLTPALLPAPPQPPPPPQQQQQPAAEPAGVPPAPQLQPEAAAAAPGAPAPEAAAAPELAGAPGSDAAAEATPAREPPVLPPAPLPADLPPLAQPLPPAAAPVAEPASPPDPATEQQLEASGSGGAPAAEAAAGLPEEAAAAAPGRVEAARQEQPQASQEQDAPEQAAAEATPAQEEAQVPGCKQS